MATISRDNPCLFITSVACNRLPVFRTDALKSVACRALDEARRSGGFALFAYVIMPEHLHAASHGAKRSLALKETKDSLDPERQEPFRKSARQSCVPFKRIWRASTQKGRATCAWPVPLRPSWL
jgi:hypothetical protein